MNMNSNTPQIQSALRRISAREIRSRALAWFVMGLLGGELLAIVVLLITRFLSIASPWWIYLIISLIPALVLTVYQLRRRDSLEQTATKTDRRLNLKDHLGTATRIDQLPSCDAGFASQLKEQALLLAKQIDPKQAVKIQWKQTLPALVGALVLVVLIIFAPLAVKKTTTNVAKDSSAGLETASLIRSVLPPADAVDPTSSDEDRDILDELAAELEDPELSQEDASRLEQKSAAHMQRMASALNKQAKQSAAQADAIAEQFRRASDAAPARTNQQKTEALASALSRGDFEQAADLLDDANRAMSDPGQQEDRALLADYLDRLADAMENQPQQNSQKSIVREQLEQLTQDPDLAQKLTSPDTNDLTQDEAIEALEEAGLDAEVARELAADLEQFAEDQKQQDDLEQQKRDMSEALERTAESFRQPPPSQPTTPDQENDNPEPRETNTEPAPEVNERPSQRETSKQSSPQQQNEPADQETPEEGDQRDPQQQNEPTDQETPGQGDQGDPQQQNEPTDQETPEQGDQGDPQQQNEPTDQETPGQGDQGDAPQSPTNPQEQSTKRQDDGRDTQQPPSGNELNPAQNKEEGQNTGEQPTGDQGLGREQTPDQKRQTQPTPASDALRQLAQKRRDAARQQNQAEQLDRALRQIVSQDSSSANGRTELTKSSDPTDTASDDLNNQLLDVRNGADPDKTTTRWLTPDGEISPNLTSQLYPTPNAVPAAEAQQIAERATTTTVVPRRYHDLIRRYFEQLGTQP